MSFLHKDKRGYWHLKERRDGKVRYVKYIGKDPTAYYASLEKGAEIATATKRYPDLAVIGSGQKILTEYKRRIFDKPQMPDKVYSTIVIDPPWPMEKITRTERPNQYDFDYSTMTIDEIKDFAIPFNPDGSHIYLWTTQKYLPLAFEVFNSWGVRYECLLTWVKNVGFTPFSFMYSTEHCLFGRIGSLPLLTLGKRLDFNSKVRGHSRKPDEFYELVKSVSPEPRIDIFSRERREGFDSYGNEPDKYQN